MTGQPALRLVTGQTVHERFTPFTQRFRYRLLMVDVDIDRLDDAARQSRFFGIDRRALFSLRRREHGACEDGPLRPWAERMLAEAGVDARGLVIRLVTFPRHLFYRFAPLSLWFASEPDGELRGVIYEVNNTFGERHSYVARVETDRSVTLADKRFHVSPFFDVTGKYRFTLRQSANALGLVIDTLVDGSRTHMATIKARYREASDAALLSAALEMPVSSIGVSIGIHWEALKLWLKGAGYRPKPAPPQTGHTLATPAID